MQLLPTCLPAFLHTFPPPRNQGPPHLPHVPILRSRLSHLQSFGNPWPDDRSFTSLKNLLRQQHSLMQVRSVYLAPPAGCWLCPGPALAASPSPVLAGSVAAGPGLCRGIHTGTLDCTSRLTHGRSLSPSSPRSWLCQWGPRRRLCSGCVRLGLHQDRPACASRRPLLPPCLTDVQARCSLH